MRYTFQQRDTFCIAQQSVIICVDALFAPSAEIIELLDT